MLNLGTQAQSYSNITGVLAGFSLTAMLLILDKETVIGNNFQNILLMFFLLFAGFIASAFTFAVNSWVTENSNLQNAKNFLLGYATAIPVILMFSGFSSINENLVKLPIASFYNIVIFLFAVFMVPSFTISTCENKMWNPIKLPRGGAGQSILYKWAYAPIIIALVIRLSMYYFHRAPWGILFYIATGGLFLLNILVIFSTFEIEKKYENKNDKYQIPFEWAKRCVIIHSIFFGLMMFK